MPQCYLWLAINLDISNRIRRLLIYAVPSEKGQAG